MSAPVVHVFDVAGDVAAKVANMVGVSSPWGLALMGVASVLKTSALVMRDSGKSIEEILRDIKMPRRLDMSWRDEIDSKIGGE